MFKSIAGSNLATKITFASLGAVVVVFVLMLLLTQMHP
jgi:hypothetical protein